MPQLVASRNYGPKTVMSWAVTLSARLLDRSKSPQDHIPMMGSPGLGVVWPTFLFDITMIRVWIQRHATSGGL